MSTSSRWDHVYGLKSVPLVEKLAEEASKLVAEDLREWPPEVESFATARDEARFQPLLAPGSPRPDDKVFAAAFHLARLELSREVEVIDEYMRNERWREVTPPGRGFDALLFLSRYLTELMLALAEATEGRVKRPQLVEILTRAERRLLAGG